MITKLDLIKKNNYIYLIDLYLAIYMY